MQGVIAAVPTPIDERKQPLRAPFLEHCRWALDNGCDGLNVLGSTGEANSLSTSARRDVMGWAADALDLARLMVGTATPALEETIDLTGHAASLGYRVALVLPPYYYKPVGEAGLVAWYTGLHEALGDADIEIFFYNYPQLTGLAIPVGVIESLARAFPSRFTGIKDSSGDLGYCRAIVASIPDFSVFPSSETALAEAHEAGFAGCISATANHTARLSAEVWRQRADPPAAALERMAAERATIAGAGLIPAVKELVAQRSADPSWRNVLPPFLPLAEEAGLKLRDELGRSR